MARYARRTDGGAGGQRFCGGGVAHAHDALAVGYGAGAKNGFHKSGDATKCVGGMPRKKVAGGIGRKAPHPYRATDGGGGDYAAFR